MCELADYLHVRPIEHSASGGSRLSGRVTAPIAPTDSLRRLQESRSGRAATPLPGGSGNRLSGLPIQGHLARRPSRALKGRRSLEGLPHSTHQTQAIRTALNKMKPRYSRANCGMVCAVSVDRPPSLQPIIKPTTAAFTENLKSGDGGLRAPAIRRARWDPRDGRAGRW
jgi:hypothetical protein